MAVVVPLPPHLSGPEADIEKVVADEGSAVDDEVNRDDRPLLQPDSSSDESAKIDEEEIVTIVLPTTSSGTWSLEKVRGLGYIVIAAFNFSIVSACVKYSSHYANSNIIVFWRMMIGLAINCVRLSIIIYFVGASVRILTSYSVLRAQVWVRHKKTNLFVGRKDRFLLLFRCLVGTSGTTMSFYAMANMPLTDAIVIIFTAPISTFILVRRVSNESDGCSQLPPN
jgi:hypothetical protein